MKGLEKTLRFIFFIFVLGGCLQGLSGCSGKLPRTVLLQGVAAEQAKVRLNNFLGASCAQAVDSDITVGWQAYGNKSLYSATLLAASPSSLRLAVVDPLNRPLLLFVSDGHNCTLVDNRSGEAFSGGNDADFWSKYLPAGLFANHIFSWLSGRIQKEGMDLISERKGENGRVYWYEIKYGSDRKHILALESNHLQRHLILDADETIILDVRYSGYGNKTGECDWPGVIHVEGKELPGSFTLRFVKTYSFSLPETKNFHLTIPPFFIVHEVE